MDFRLPSLKRLPLLAAAVWAGASLGEAQPADTNAWQPIIFSSPGDTQISSNLISPPAQPSSSSLQSKLRLFQDQSPVTTFNFAAPPVAPAPAPNRVRWFQKPPGGSRDWESMTPAEIMGVSPSQLLPTDMGDTNSDQAALALMKRFLGGQNPFTQLHTNSFGNPSPEQNLWANGDDQTNDTSSGLSSGGWSNSPSAIFSPSSANQPGDNWFASPNGASSWSVVSPSPAQAQNTAPQAQPGDMSQFMQLLDLGSTPATAPVTAPAGVVPFQSQTSSQNSGSTALPAASIGASFAPLSSDISKPAGLAPLPTIVQPAGAQPVVPSIWASQPLLVSPTPPTFAVPKRKF